MEEEEMIRLAKLNNEEAFELLVEKYKPIIEKFSFQFGMNQENISDVVQETFIKIHRNLNQFHTGKLSTWIYQITLNVTRDYYRKRKRDINLLNKAKKSQLEIHKETLLFVKEEHVILHECLQKLKMKHKTPLILFYFHDKSYEEIAVILKIKLSLVKTRIHQGKKQLRELYDQYERKEVYVNG
ncbi:RNA polymerase sigma factor [Virgibacillus sp. C22-A2]|uniref:RNA polymerase sigma factor n=1 Tax=Virgibacillus tibetensis TaxID=3042313 RepID=A0ABU6KIH2_9BACI|nr:RNA polymerase sigma factor [Virgibacillus sp. C22-A2]